MTKLFRISATEHIKDMTGTGARLHGGRWNQKGYPAIYTSESRSLAALEYLVHVPMALAPDNLSIIEITIPADIKPKQIAKSQLPPNWRDYPAPEKLVDLGTKWIRSKTSLLLRVPSAVVEKESNILINPLHPQMKKVTLKKAEPFTFDTRLLK